MDDVSESSVPLTPEEAIVQRHIEASGGLDNLRAIQSMRASGNANIMSYDLVYGIRQKRPNKVRIDIAMESMGVEIMSAYDGETGWSVNPMQGPRPQKLTGAQLRGLQLQADLDGLLIGYQEKGYSLALEGEEDVRGAVTQKIKVTMPDSSEAFAYLDTQTLLLSKMEMQGVDPQTGNPVTTETYFSDYREVAGTQFPFHIESVVGGGAFTSEVVFETVEPNVEIDDAIFAIPE